MERRFDFYDQQNICTTFIQADDFVWLVRLCGLTCGFEGGNSGPPGVRGLFTVRSENGISESGEFKLLTCRQGDNFIALEWELEESCLIWKSHWTLNPDTGIWSRKDALVNSGKKALMVQRALPRFVFSPGELNIYAQASSWAHENQGEWINLPRGELTLRSQAGRTNQGASPYLFLHLKDTDSAIAFHILPRGDWVIRVNRSISAGNPITPFTAVELGLSDDILRMEIPPGAAFALPEVLIQPVQSSEPEKGAPGLHRYILDRFFSVSETESSVSPKKIAPLIYNTWFDAFDFIEVDRLRNQLAAVKEVGCEVFVVDAGWYGNGAGAWDKQVGDWSEKRAAAFHGRMQEFAEEVRGAGLGFGLWMEPERIAPNTPVAKAHPDWFLPGRWGYFYPDLSQRVVRDYLMDEISRLIETYRLAWLKVDFNLEMGKANDNSASYYQSWYGMLDELRQHFPETFFEGCSSGGMRLDLNTLTHFDGHFLSDTVNPLDILRITQGALLRVPPGRLTRWAVLRPAGALAQRYSLPLDQTPQRILTPGGGGWEDAYFADVDFVCRAALPGMFGYSGDLAGLSPEILARLRHHSQFYKRWRTFITGSVCHLLTPIRSLEDRGGWAAFQMQNPKFTEVNLVFAYRLDDDSTHKSMPLRGLDLRLQYAVANDDFPGEQPGIFSGIELTNSGLPVQLPTKNSAVVFIIQPQTSGVRSFSWYRLSNETPVGDHTRRLFFGGSMPASVYNIYQNRK